MNETPDWLTKYQQAYVAFNGEKCPPITRRGSWWVIHQNGVSHKRRRSELEEATKRLLALAKASPTHQEKG